MRARKDIAVSDGVVPAGLGPEVLLMVYFSSFTCPGHKPIQLTFNFQDSICIVQADRHSRDRAGVPLRLLDQALSRGGVQLRCLQGKTACNQCIPTFGQSDK